jgi:HNH endonuclease
VSGTSSRVIGCRGCLGQLVIAALLALPIIVLLGLVRGAPEAQAGELALVTVALLAIRNPGRGRAGPRQVTGSHFRGNGVGLGQPREAATIGEARDGRASVVQNSGRIQPAHAHARLPNGSVGSRREPDRASRTSPIDRSDTPPAALARRARDPLPARLRFGILQRDGFRCRYCDRPSSASGVVLHVDHVVPLAAGGAMTDDNLVTACAERSLGKATRTVVGSSPEECIDDSAAPVALSEHLGPGSGGVQLLHAADGRAGPAERRHVGSLCGLQGTQSSPESQRNPGPFNRSKFR